MPDDENILYADGLEDAFIGIIHSKVPNPKLVMIMISVSMCETRDGMTHEEAVDFSLQCK